MRSKTVTMFQWKASDFVLVAKKLKFYYLFGKTFVADFVFNVFMTNVPNVLVQAASNHAFTISIFTVLIQRTVQNGPFGDN